MASKLYNIIVGGASVGAGAYFTTWLLTGESPNVRIIFIFSYKILRQLFNFIIFNVINNYSKMQEIQTVQAEVGKKTGRKRTLPPRNTQIQSLKSDNFDVLIIGGGATGAGCAIDSVTRGKVYVVKVLYKSEIFELFY